MRSPTRNSMNTEESLWLFSSLHSPMFGRGAKCGSKHKKSKVNRTQCIYGRGRGPTDIKQSAHNRTQVGISSGPAALCRQLTVQNKSCMQMVFELGIKNGQKPVWCSWQEMQQAKVETNNCFQEYPMWLHFQDIFKDSISKHKITILLETCERLLLAPTLHLSRI